MRPLSRRLYLFFSQIFFTLALAPLFLWPRLAETNLMRRLIAFSFGSLLAKRYHLVIKSFGDLYGAALEAGLRRAASLVAGASGVVVDCGTGSGFASRGAARHFPGSLIVGFDVVPAMLDQAKRNALEEDLPIAYVSADTLKLPLRDGAVDIVVAQNTAPYLREFARVCRPGGLVVFVDTAAQLIRPLAQYAAERTGCFDLVEAGLAEAGFYLVARRVQFAPATDRATDSQNKEVAKTPA